MTARIAQLLLSLAQLIDPEIEDRISDSVEKRIAADLAAGRGRVAYELNRQYRRNPRER